MRKSLLLLCLIFLPGILWAQNSDSKSGSSGDEVSPSSVKEIAEDRADELLNPSPTEDSTEQATTLSEPVNDPTSSDTIEAHSNTAAEEPSEPPADSLTPPPLVPPPIPQDNLTASGPNGEPDWVGFFKSGEIGRIAEGYDSFFGVGRSRRNQADADSHARVEFAQNVETRVDSSYEELAEISGSREKLSLNISTEIKTNMSLKGVSITSIWYDKEGKTYYSLIRIPRNEYAALLEQNIREELAMQKTRLAQERARVEAEAEEQRLADLEERHRQEEEARTLEEKRRRQALREQRKSVYRQKFARFMERTPQPQMIGFRNGQLASTFQRYGISTGISPGISPWEGSQLLQRISFGYTILKFLEVYGVSSFQQWDDSFGWASQELGAKIRLLNNAGDVTRISLGAGGNVSFYDIFDENEMGATFFASGVISMPYILYSDLSFYLGLDKVALGLTTYPLFGIFGDALGLIGEANYLIDERLRQEAYDDGFLFQGGLRFKTGKRLATTLSYEDHSKVVLSVDLYF
ncbi:MAG: hypothetical protein JEY99_21555 [Spirochaetales bacterium]|nr:hypothetical protein [Spirochaetales bacterium]